jgi:hypothetical protein
MAFASVYFEHKIISNSFNFVWPETSRNRSQGKLKFSKCEAPERKQIFKAVPVQVPAIDFSGKEDLIKVKND